MAGSLCAITPGHRFPEPTSGATAGSGRSPRDRTFS
jgi:hypothetical protein